MERRKAGRRPKPPREPITVRFPPEHKRAYEQAAADLGLSFGDYVAFTLAKQHGLEIPAYIEAEMTKHRARVAARAAAEELPISA